MYWCVVMRFDFSVYDLQAVDASTQTLASILFNKGFGEYHFTEKTRQQKQSTLKFKAFGGLSIVEYGVGIASYVSMSNADLGYQLHVVLTGHSTEQCHNSGRMLRAGDSMMIMPKEQMISYDSTDCKKLIVTIPTEFLHQTVREFGYFCATEQIHFAPVVSRFPMAGPLFNLLNDMLQQDKSALGERALVYYCKLLSGAILNVFHNTVVPGSLSAESLHRHITRIRHYVLDNITTDITIEELAHLCQISRKSLYNLFERETGLTPSTYVRRLKLESAHAELKNNERIKNVTQVALKYGFTNLGRFSAQYREQIGELPSQTLRDFSY
ncbi:AraC family transcriptional regulator [Marinomonas hwangdonensis]|uniref:AraC family transcriptional regulator n=2 Tax=Marinomonas hwangdonensis TaxID=1053647 RepID=A0A3M8Q6D4_9GAMM|nr:AraC family transcriptional regulator [Marinomonas hwangdonensis]